MRWNHQAGENTGRLVLNLLGFDTVNNFGLKIVIEISGNFVREKWKYDQINITTELQLHYVVKMNENQQNSEESLNFLFIENSTQFDTEYYLFPCIVMI